MISYQELLKRKTYIIPVNAKIDFKEKNFNVLLNRIFFFSSKTKKV
jgi:hypothetical protein